MIEEVEWEQIKTAITCMEHYNINGQMHISQNNVLALLQTFTNVDFEVKK